MRHPNEAFLLCGDRLDDDGLNNGHQRHVGISRHSDRTDVFGTEHLRNKDGGRAVRRTDDTDGGGIL